MLTAQVPALILAPMDGLTDAPMRAVCGEWGAFSFSVSEFLRVNSDPIPKHVFLREAPELAHGGRTASGLAVQVQLLGGDPDRMAESAAAAVDAGAQAIDINFGCPAPTVNRHDGGATLLKFPDRLFKIVSTVRQALPAHIPVSAKLRLGWDCDEAIVENAENAALAGAGWITIHGRTRMEGYHAPARWLPIGEVRARLNVPVVANGDIRTIEEFRRCRAETGCTHFMIGRGALADPRLPGQIAVELGLMSPSLLSTSAEIDWPAHLQRLVCHTARVHGHAPRLILCRLKQWLKIASVYGTFDEFDAIKRSQSVEELFDALSRVSKRGNRGRNSA